MNPDNRETIPMADEVSLKPKVSCPECLELYQDYKISAHIERHRPCNPPGPDTRACPKGCGRNLSKSDMKEHIDLCDGSLPLPSKKVLGSVTPAVEPPPAIVNKEEPVPTGKPKLKCPICGIPLKNPKALGGHMGAHRSGRRGSKPVSLSAQTAAKPAKRPAKKRGKRVAARQARPGDNLPPSPTRVPTSPAGSAGAAIRAAASQKRAQAQELLTKANELEKLADRADELL